METEKRLGGIIRLARLQKRLSQIQLAKQLGMTQATISRAENGLDLRLSTLVDIARALDLEPLLAPRSLVPAIESLVGGGRARRNALIHDADDNRPYVESLDHDGDVGLPKTAARFAGGGKAVPISRHER